MGLILVFNQNDILRWWKTFSQIWSHCPSNERFTAFNEISTKFNHENSTVGGGPEHFIMAQHIFHEDG